MTLRTILGLSLSAFDTWYLKHLGIHSQITSPISDKMGVGIFRYFAADRQFGTYAILFLGVKLP